MRRRASTLPGGGSYTLIEEENLQVLYTTDHAMHACKLSGELTHAVGIDPLKEILNGEDPQKPLLLNLRQLTECQSILPAELILLSNHRFRDASPQTPAPVLLFNAEKQIMHRFDLFSLPKEFWKTRQVYFFENPHTALQAARNYITTNLNTLQN